MMELQKYLFVHSFGQVATSEISMALATTMLRSLITWNCLKTIHYNQLMLGARPSTEGKQVGEKINTKIRRKWRNRPLRQRCKAYLHDVLYK